MKLEVFRKKYNYISATPVMQQFLDIKFAHIECLVLFRMGDFYELFYEDAITASRILGIALTKKGKTGENVIEMCGVPYHALENYLNKLLEDGFKVAVCDQLETPEEAKKRGGYKAIVKRDVTRIITPGTIIEDSLLQCGEPNYLASLSINKNNVSICYVDLSTAEILVISIPEAEIINEITRIRPKEILLSDKYRASELTSILSRQLGVQISFQVDSFFASKKCTKIILDYYNIKAIEAIGDLSEVVCSSIGSIIEYISLTQKQNLPKLPKPKMINYNKFMHIDAATRRNLELSTALGGGLKGSLFSSIDNTISKAGSRLLYRFLASPLVDIDKINYRLNITNFFYQNINLVDKVRKEMKKIGDLKRCVARINMSRSTPKDLLSIKYTIEVAELIQAGFLRYLGTNLPEYIEEMLRLFVGNHQIYDLINNAIKEDAPSILSDGNIINLTYHPKVKELLDLINNSKIYIEALRDKYRKETGIDSLKISNNNIIGLFIDITSRHSGKVLGEKFIHRQTTANSIRYTTLELQELESKMINAKHMSINLEKEIYNEICAKIAKHSANLIKLADVLAKLDVFCSFAKLAKEREYCYPEILNNMTFEIMEGRHPVVEQSLLSANGFFLKNDCILSCDERIWLITGPNMAGKSTFLRQNALIAILAHIGCFVPAKVAKIGVIDKIFSRIGAADDLNKGQSTFMVEMIETSAILTQSTHKSLIILDEVGRGTSTYDGVAIAWSVLEHIHDKIRARCLFATHYHELTSMESIMPALRKYTVDIEESNNKILFLYKIIKGVTDRSYGVHVAQIAGLPQSVIRRANELLQKFEKDSTKSNKRILKNESINMRLFDLQQNQANKVHQQIFDEINYTEPDKLTPQQALDIVYKLKEIASS